MACFLQSSTLAAAYHHFHCCTQGGDCFDDVLQEAVRGCTAFIAICSPTYGSDASKFTRLEFRMADANGKLILPVFHSGSWPVQALEFLLSSRNYVPRAGSMTALKVPVATVVAEVLDALSKRGVLPILV